MVEHLKYPWIPKRAIENIPFHQNLNESDCQRLTHAVRVFEEAAKAGVPLPVAATHEVDSVLKRAYGIDDKTVSKLRAIAQWDTNPQISLDTPAEEEGWHVSGVVESISAAEGKLVVWLEGFTEFANVAIDAKMPGWMLRAGAAFRTTIPRSCVRSHNLKAIKWGAFSPQEYCYMEEEELFDELTGIFYPTAAV